MTQILATQYRPKQLNSCLFKLFESRQLMVLIRIITLGTVLILSACSDNAEPQFKSLETTSAVSQPIRFALVSAPVTLSPLYATDATSVRINRLLYQRLVDFAVDGHPIPSLASWQRINLRHYRFTLKLDEYAQLPRFHHNKELTAQDVKASYQAVLDKKNASPHRKSLAHIERMDVLDKRTIDFYLSRDDALFPAFLVIGIMPKDLLKTHHPFNTQPVGSGDFVFSQWPFEGQLFLRRRSDKQLFEFLKVKDPTLRVLKLLRGEVDIVQNNLPPEHIQFLQKRAEDKTNPLLFLTKKGANYSYLGFNLQDKDTGSLLLRQAIAYALDRDKIIRYALGNAAQKAEGFFPEYHWLGSALMPYDFQQKKAIALMHQLGYSEKKRLSLSYKTSSDPFRIRIASIIQSQLKAVFIDVDIRSYDWGTFYGDIKKGHFQMYSLTWVGINTPDIFRYVFHSDSIPPTGANRGRLLNASIDQLIEQAEQEQDMAHYVQNYQRLQKKIQQVLPYVSLWYEDNIAFLRRDIIGYEVSANGNYDALHFVSRQTATH